jgi:hypothetical protein
MTATAGNDEWDEIIRTWGHAYTLRHDPHAPANERCTAQPLGTDVTLRAEAPAALLDAIKDDAAARAFTTDGTS